MILRSLLQRFTVNDVNVLRRARAQQGSHPVGAYETMLVYAVSALGPSSSIAFSERLMSAHVTRCPTMSLRGVINAIDLFTEFLTARDHAGAAIIS
jgi:hypothetical protein